jgi:HlyD family secretion protein
MRDRFSWTGWSLALLPALVLAGCGDGVEQSGSVVDLSAAERRDIVVAAEATGVIEPIQIVEIKSKASGEVIKMAVETGQVVEKGDLLVQVDTRDLRNAVEQAQADLEVAEASLTVATAQKERSDKLLAGGMISDQQHEDALLDFATSKAQVVKARTSLELANERLYDATVRAPSTGTVLQKNVEEGNIISSATSQISDGTLLLTMADLSYVQVRTLVDETDIGRIEPGLRATITVEAFRDHDFTGTVLKVEPLAVVEQSVTMFPVLAQISNEEGLLKPGMNADVEIHIDQRRDVLAVPLEAVRSPQEMAILAPLVGLTSDDVMGMMESMRERMGGGPGGGAEGEKTGEGGAPSRRMSPGSGDAHGGGGPVAGPSAAQRRASGAGPSASQSGTPGAGPPGGMRGGTGTSGGAPGSRGGMPSGGMGGHPGMGRGGPGGFGSQAGRSGRMPMGIAFVKTGEGFEARFVRTGASDWDYIEVLRGLEEGEEVALLPSAQLYMENERMMERFRSRSSVVGSSRSR